MEYARTLFGGVFSLLTAFVVFTASVHADTIGANFPQSALVEIPHSEWRDLTSPFDSKQIGFFFGPSSPPLGQTVVLKATGPILLHIYREGSELTDPADIQITITNDGASNSTQLQFDDLDVRHPGFIRRLELTPKQSTHLSLRVVDSASGGPTRRRPYTLLLEAWPLSQDGEVQIVDGTEQKSALETPYCKRVTSLSRESRYLEPAESISLQSVDARKGAALVRLINAGGLLGVKVSAGKAQLGRPAKLKLFAKPSGDGPFQIICDGVSLESVAASNFLEAFAPGLDQHAIWRIEIISDPRSGSTKPNAAHISEETIDIVKERLVDRVEPYYADNDWNTGKGFLCFEKETLSVGMPTGNNRYATNTELEIAIDDSQATLSSKQRALVVEQILGAVSIWVRACVICKPDNLSVIRVGDEVYVHPGIARVINSRSIFGGKTLDFDSLEAERLLESFVGNSRIGSSTPFEKYARLAESSNADVRYFCKLSSSGTTSPMLDRIRSAICGEPGETNKERAFVQLRFLDDGSACGGDSNAIACLRNRMTTELNIRDFRFTTFGSSDIAIGKGRSEVSLKHTLIHEMGHWIGVIDHLNNSDHSIMAESMEKARCIDYDTVDRTIGVIEKKSSNQLGKSGDRSRYIEKFKLLSE